MTATDMGCLATHNHKVTFRAGSLCRGLGLLPLSKSGQRPGLGVQDNDPTGRRTLHNVVASAPSHDSCLRAEMTCLSAGAPASPLLPSAPLCPHLEDPYVPYPSLKGSFLRQGFGRAQAQWVKVFPRPCI